MTVSFYMKQITAYKLVAEAKRKGELVPGDCALADGDCHGRIEAHHEDYDQPLEVTWLCNRHHRRLHEARKVTAVRS